MSFKTPISGKFGKVLDETVAKMTQDGKGLLAADESVGTIQKRFDMIQVENNEENRRAYRELLFTSPGIEKFISGVILYEETCGHKTSDGKRFIDLLNEKGIVSGIKLDAGTFDLWGEESGCKGTRGLDDLADRAKLAFEMGCRFAKWRAQIKCSQTQPSQFTITDNARTLASYAAICQQNGLVPIIEPEIMVLVGDHDIERSLKVTQTVLSEVFNECIRQNVELKRAILKPNFVLPGRDSENFDEEFAKVADYTYHCLSSIVPPAIRGIMFLSGGLSEREAVQVLQNLNAIKDVKPWALTFSYGRALQFSCLNSWKGHKKNWKDAQDAFLQQAEICYNAALRQ